MRKLLFFLLLSLLVTFACADLPTPEIRYYSVVPKLELEFELTELFPPAGFGRWRIDMLYQSVWKIYYDDSPVRTATVRLAEPLEPGLIWMTVYIEDSFGAVMDNSQMLDYTVMTGPEVYSGIVPRIAVDGDWNTSLAITAGPDPLTSELCLYDEAGVLSFELLVDVAAHASAAFYLDDLISGPFYGSAEIKSDQPLTYVYLCIGPGGQMFTFCRDLTGQSKK